MSLYTDLVDAGVPVSNWQSDLYAPATPEVCAMLKKHGVTTATTFKNQVEGGIWLDIPFQFDPFWEQRK